MKCIKGTGWYNLNNKSILIVSDDYEGNPLIMWEYDVLICSERVYNQFKDDLIAQHLTKKGWYPDVRYL